LQTRRIMEQSTEDTDSFAWISKPFSNEGPELNKSLQDFEQSSLHCTICRQFYRNAVSLRTCHHSFCSECIRVSLSHEKRGMKRIGTCPICRTEVKEDGGGAIMANWGLQDAVDKFKNMRSILHSSLVRLHCLEQEKGDVVGKLENIIDSVESVDSSSRTTGDLKMLNQRKAIPDRRCRKRKLTKIEVCEDQELNEEHSDDESSDAEYVDQEVLGTGTPTGRVIVSSRVANPYLKNIHSIDLSEPLSSATLERIKPRTIPVYHGMKKSKLQDLCKSEGMISKGNDRELKERHLDFLRLWNAECDAKNPRSKDQLVREMTRRESARKAEVKKSMLSGIQAHTTYIERIKESRKALGAEEHSSITVSSGNATFDHTMEMGFKNLIKLYNTKKAAAENSIRNDVVDSNGTTYQNEIAQVSEDKILHIPGPPAEKLPQPSLPSMENSVSINPSPITVIIRDLPLNGVTTRSRSGLPRGVTKKAATGATTSTLDPSSNSNPFVKQSALSSKKNTAPTSLRQKWTCNQCTYVNDYIPWSNTKAKCGMCQMSRNLGMVANTIGTSKEVVEIDQ